jgi:DNA transformation protein and related proteins
MPSSPEFIDHIRELLSLQGRILARRMFGGHGIYCDGLFIGIVDDEVLYLKTDDASCAEFERAGSAVFTYQRAGKTARLGFHTVPDEAMDSPALISPWVRLAIQAALRARTDKPARKIRTRPAVSRRSPRGNS